MKKIIFTFLVSMIFVFSFKVSVLSALTCSEIVQQMNDLLTTVTLEDGTTTKVLSRNASGKASGLQLLYKTMGCGTSSSASSSCPSGYTPGTDNMCYRCGENQYLATDNKCYCNTNYYANSSTGICQYNPTLQEKYDIAKKNNANYSEIQTQNNKFKIIWENINPECVNYTKISFDNSLTKMTTASSYYKSNESCLADMWCNDINVWQQYSSLLEDQKNTAIILNQDIERCRSEKGTLTDYNNKNNAVIAQLNSNIEKTNAIQNSLKKEQELLLSFVPYYKSSAREFCLKKYIAPLMDESKLLSKDDLDGQLAISEKTVATYESFFYKQCLIDNSCQNNSTYNSSNDSCICNSGYKFNSDNTICEKTDNLNISTYSNSYKTLQIKNYTKSNYKYPLFKFSGINNISGYYVYFGLNKDADPVKLGKYITKNEYQALNINKIGDYYLIVKTKSKDSKISDSYNLKYTYTLNLSKEEVAVLKNKEKVSGPSQMKNYKNIEKIGTSLWGNKK